MARFLKDRSATQGQVPGSLIFIGHQKMDNPKLRIIEYNASEIDEKEITSNDLDALLGKRDKNIWLNLDGLHDLDFLKTLGDACNMHSLHLEDVTNTDLRPKFESYDEESSYLFFSLKNLGYSKEAKKVFVDQVSVVLAEKLVVTFKEKSGEVFQAVRERLRKSKGRIRNTGTDYLAYAILDTIVDNYMIAIQSIGDDIEELEEEILKHTSSQLVKRIYFYKTELNVLRRNILPVKDMLAILLRTETPLIHKKTIKFYRDLYELVMQVSDTIETYYQMLSDQLTIYNSNVSNHMNQIMKTLTIFAAIFIPLTFLAGVYGTNFKYLPELQFAYSYPIFWIVNVSIAAILIVYFKRRKWF